MRFLSVALKNSLPKKHFSFLFRIFVPNVQDCAGFCQLDKDNGKEMRVIDLINSNEKTAFSFEILPPLKGTGIEKLYETIDTLREFDPKYINITTHRSEYVYKDLGNGLFQRNRLRRRPGTVSVAAAIQNKYNITVVPHILCSGFSREDTEYVLLDLQFLNITDLLVLRGDKAKHESVFTPKRTVIIMPLNCRNRLTNSIRVSL